MTTSTTRLSAAVFALMTLFGACAYTPAKASDDSSLPPSCIELEPTCGPSGDEDCCATIELPGGTFDRGRDLAADGMFTDTAHPATVPPFELDTYEVTVGRYRRFLDAGMGTRGTPPSPGSGARTIGGVSGQGGWQADWRNSLLASPPVDLYVDLACDAAHSAWTPEPGDNESHAMSCVNWYEAFAFCAWDGGFLPTEAEWSFAAAGGDEQRAYPWSAPASSLAVDCSFANYSIDYPDGFCTDNGAPHPVGVAVRGNGRWGHADLAGNVGEWVLDSYAATYTDGPCDGCANLTSSGERVVRGGDWANASPTLRSSYRNHTNPETNRDPKIGFRCARALEASQ